MEIDVMQWHGGATERVEIEKQTMWD